MRMIAALLVSALVTFSAGGDIKVATWNIYWLGDGEG